MIATGSGTLEDVMAADAERCAAGEQRFTREPSDCEALWYRATFGRHLQAVQVHELSPGIRERRFVEGPR